MTITGAQRRRRLVAALRRVAAAALPIGRGVIATLIAIWRRLVARTSSLGRWRPRVLWAGAVLA
ncbi:MAG: hypothetical protein ACREQ5_18660, partial [Candidatus Dormibacteria bacterium]